ncbi:hypothetical protein AMAG_04674 [Allomyces macrogynus ATCC 38327]|uniref:Uncharacterized protein n=1 Tax=Allomyces macrogynus (strain ATCC 38327) TaxID=578462 RepID=A0A0L0S5P5_ALLM3|nr:hypothetical protein AMAG_04674 [Allomyces macrogynus ATCC 38327]|eukprot:KNE57827.1 hypothetical protein AMAG_04674 [Allomyces macrogynus ATCC 38327]
MVRNVRPTVVPESRGTAFPSAQNQVRWAPRRRQRRSSKGQDGVGRRRRRARCCLVHRVHFNGGHGIGDQELTDRCRFELGSTQEEQLLFQHLEHLKQLQLGIALSHAAQNGAGDGASPTSQAPGSTTAPPPPRNGPDATADAASAPAGMANPDTYKKNLDRFAIKREQTQALTAKLDELRSAMHDVTATARVIHAKVSAPVVPGGQDATMSGGAKQPAEGPVPGPVTGTGASTPAVFSRGATNLTVNTGAGPL